MTKAKAKLTVPVSERAAIQRINRVLRKNDEVLKATRPGPARTALGYFYVLNIRGNYPADTNVDLQKLGRDLAALKPWEEVVYDS
jgi:hypothetical protein